jgi:probable F420-dependent oxidoreductase
MRFGLGLPHYDTSLAGGPVSWNGVKAVAQTAEASGFDSVWVSDHLFLDWSKYGGSDEPQGSLECWTTMAGLAAATERVRIGSLALCNDFRNPALLAKMIATLDQLSGGRVDVGLGAGWYEAEYRAAGIDFYRPGVRIERLGESLQIIARLLEGEELIFKGEHYLIDGAICRPGPVQSPRPPLWVGGKGDKLLATAAAHADGWNFSWIGSIETYKERAKVADEACEKAGRDPKSLRRSVGAYVMAGTDEADLKARFENLIAHTPDGVLRVSSGGPAVSWDEFRAGRIAGTVSEVVDQIGSLAELGVEEVIVGLGALPFQIADEEDVSFIGEEIIARLAGDREEKTP